MDGQTTTILYINFDRLYYNLKWDKAFTPQVSAKHEWCKPSGVNPYPTGGRSITYVYH